MNDSSAFKLEPRRQNTLASEAFYSGVGIHTGQCVEMRLLPAPVGSGIRFRRVDIPGAPVVAAHADNVCDTARSTTIGQGAVRIHTVEHLLAALNAFDVDNVVVELSNLEPPVADGSSLPFVELIENASIVEQRAPAQLLTLEVPEALSVGDIQLVAIPCDHFRISYTLCYPNVPRLCSQFQSFAITPELFKREIAPCRTFSLYEEVTALMDRGLIKGGSLDNAVIIEGETIFSKGGLRFSDEMVRHKILDMVGDLALVGSDIAAHIIAIKSGHGTNVAFARQLRQLLMKESTVCQNL